MRFYSDICFFDFIPLSSDYIRWVYASPIIDVNSPFISSILLIRAYFCLFLIYKFSWSNASLFSFIKQSS